MAFINALFIYDSTSNAGFEQNEQNQIKNCVSAKCHNEIFSQKIIHEPLRKDCLICHKQNGSKHPDDNGSEFELLKKTPQLCFDCHKKDASDATSVHPLFDEGNCKECHLPHSANNKALLVEFQEKAICLKCHDPMDGKKVIHKPSIDGQCIKCHHPHYSSLEKLVAFDQPDLCLNCHNKPIQTETRMLSNIKEKLTLRKVHSPVESGKCTDCHAAHSSDNNAMLIRKFFPNKYIEGKFESFQLCFACHSEQLMTSPTSDSLTNFRNGTRNLHFVHVNKTKGRNCIDCHDVHGSNNLRTIKDFVEFGNWKMPIKFVKADSGGTCSPGCHKKQTYKYQNKYSLHEEPVAGVVDESTEEPETDDEEIVEEEVVTFEVESVENNTFLIKNDSNNTTKSITPVTRKLPQKIVIKKDVPKAFSFKENSKPEISQAMKPYLSSIVKYLKKKKKTKLLIEVNMDYTKSENPMNDAQEFANNSLMYLNKKGISSSRIIVKPILIQEDSKKQNQNKTKSLIFKIID